MTIDKHCKFQEIAPILVKYVRITKDLERVRRIALLDLMLMYNTLNKMKIECHDEILKIVGTTREDVEFDRILSEYVYEMIHMDDLAA